MNLTTYPYPAPKLGIGDTVPPLLLYVFVGPTRTTEHFWCICVSDEKCLLSLSCLCALLPHVPAWLA